MNTGFSKHKIKHFLVNAKAALYLHYTAPQVAIFKTMRSGFMVFFTGLVTFYIANTNFPPSIQQELLTLVGLIACAIGFFIAITAYIRLVISRLILFFTRK